MKTLVDQANLYLTKLAVLAVKPWDTHLIEAGPDYVDGFKTKYKKWLAEDKIPYGSFKGSTATLLEFVPEILPSQVTPVLQLLKENYKICQIGPGKGFCIVILDRTVLSSSLEPTKTTPTTMLKELGGLVEDYRMVSSRLEKAQDRIAELVRENEELKADKNSRFLTTWS